MQSQHFPYLLEGIIEDSWHQYFIGSLETGTFLKPIGFSNFWDNLLKDCASHFVHKSLPFTSLMKNSSLPTITWTSLLYFERSFSLWFIPNESLRVISSAFSRRVWWDLVTVEWIVSVKRPPLHFISEVGQIKMDIQKPGSLEDAQ